MKVGDRVICGTSQPIHSFLKGMTGTIKVTHVANSIVGVSWDNWQKGNNLEGKIKDTSGWFVLENEIELILNSVTLIKEL